MPAIALQPAKHESSEALGRWRFFSLVSAPIAHFMRSGDVRLRIGATIATRKQMLGGGTQVGYSGGSQPVLGCEGVWVV